MWHERNQQEMKSPAASVIPIVDSDFRAVKPSLYTGRQTGLKTKSRRSA
jgi:hypothetical protein